MSDQEEDFFGGFENSPVKNSSFSGNMNKKISFNQNIASPSESHNIHRTKETKPGQFVFSTSSSPSSNPKIGDHQTRLNEYLPLKSTLQQNESEGQSYPRQRHDSFDKMNHSFGSKQNSNINSSLTNKQLAGSQKFKDGSSKNASRVYPNIGSNIKSPTVPEDPDIEDFPNENQVNNNKQPGLNKTFDIPDHKSTEGNRFSSQNSQPFSDRTSIRKDYSTQRSSGGSEYDFLFDKWDEFFPNLTKENRDYEALHYLILGIFNGYNYPKFRSLIEWNLQKKLGSVEVFIDLRKLSELKNNAAEDEGDLFKLLSEIPKFLVDSPEQIIPATSLTLEKIMVHKLDKRVKPVLPRFYNMENTTNLADIKANIIGNFITIKGVVLGASSVKLLVKEMGFFCPECKTLNKKIFTRGVYEPPKSCTGSQKQKCSSSFLIPDKNSAITVLYQRIKVQELDEEAGSGRIPKKIDVELKDNLINSVISGDVIVVSGVLQTELSEDIKGAKKNQNLFVNFLEANSIINQKDRTKNLSKGEDEFTEEEIKIIISLGKNPRIFPLLIKSLCPTIYGHELVKAGLLLGILGGATFSDSTTKQKASQNAFAQKSSKYQGFRSDCHVLLIGDPGLGKSQILKFLANVAPRSVYICGNASSKAGLTVTVSKDSSSGEGSLEAGALVLSDQGVCCIDEFDKMNSEHMALLEAMEQQTVTVAKGGVLCSLQTRTSIIASANPEGGHYNRSKGIKDNIKLSNAILSRFDLIFLMLDQPDPNRDQKLSAHVMKLHNSKRRKRDEFEGREDENPLMTLSQFQQNFKLEDFNYGNKKSASKSNPKVAARMNSQAFNPLAESFEQNIKNNKYQSLTEKYTVLCEQISPNQILDPFILRKYICFAKKNYFPSLSREAADILRDFYISLRENSDSDSTIPVTTRQLESLIRLAQARAKIELRSTVTKDDAFEVVELMQESLFDALEDMSMQNGSLKISKTLKTAGAVGSLSVPKQTKVFLEQLSREVTKKGSKIFEYQELITVAKTLNLNVGDFSEFVDKLNNQNYLMLRPGKQYELLYKSGF